MLKKQSLLMMLLGLACSPIQSTIMPFTATYDVHVEGFSIGTATKDLKKVNAHQFRYEVHPKINAIAKLLMNDRIHMYSVFDIKAHDLLPQEYFFEQTGGRKEKHVKLIFNKERVCNTLNNQCWTIRHQHTYDPLSLDIAYPLALQHQASNQAYTVITGNKKVIEKTTFHIDGEEIITVPAGRFKTLKVTMNQPGKKRPTQLWLGEDTQFTPIKVIQHRKHEIQLELSYYAEPAASQVSYSPLHPHKVPLFG